ncbi:MAG: xanthine dehydrogenase accessory protein XdhC [Meiothermus sp.]|nr:xanthine dehydrogenase accessory protein XdhC [Meiothermus sp.]
MRWFEHLARLTEQRVPLVMVTVVSVRGHAPREAGAKMLVTADGVFGTVGGGNLEATAVEKARAILGVGPGEMRQTLGRQPQTLTLRLTDKADGPFGVQCCGGEVELLLEPVFSSRPAVAVFGVGHVGLALAKVLSIFSIELWLVDSRAEMLAEERLEPLRHDQAELKVHHAPILDGVVTDLPAGSLLLIMTHDHAEDLFVLETALRRADLGYVGLIGSSVKWANFRRKLKGQGFSDQDLARVTTPIGIPDIRSKAPEAIAVAVAAQLVPFILEGAVENQRSVNGGGR